MQHKVVYLKRYPDVFDAVLREYQDIRRLLRFCYKTRFS